MIIAWHLVHIPSVLDTFLNLQLLFNFLSRLKTDCSIRETSGSEEVNAKSEMFRSGKK